MHRRILSISLTGFVAIVFFSWSCTKMDTTTIGSDLIPAVDNVNTFADTLPIITTQQVFNDSTKLTLFEDYALGKISSDAVFGQTDATLYLQLKPPFYPFYFGVPHDTITAIDSVVLCLNYRGIYGDSTTPITFTVNEVSTTAHGAWDSLYYSGGAVNLRPINFAPATGASLVDNPTLIDVRTIDDSIYIKNKTEKVANQIRIKLSNSFAQKLGLEDSTLIGDAAFLRDSLFRSVFNGFAVSATSGNSILYTNLTDTKTRLEIHYKRKNGGTVDTTSYSFFFNDGTAGSSGPRRSAVADNIVRTRNGLPAGDQEILLQTTPGTYANLDVPRLSGYTNRIIHRAEIQIEQIPSADDATFSAPNYLYLDLRDSTADPKWKTIYYDLNPGTLYDPDNQNGYPYFPGTYTVDHSYFGAALKKKTDGSGTRGFYNINITRYIQRMVISQSTNYQMRLYSPQSVSYPQYVDVANGVSPFIQYDNTIAYGRVKIGGGANPDINYRMKLRIIWSELK